MSQRAGQWIDGGQQQRGGGSLYKCTRAIVHNASRPPSPSPLPPTCLIVHRKNKRRPPGNSGTSIKAHPQAPHGHPSISVTLRVTGPTTWPFPGPQAARPYVFGKSRFSIFGIRFPPHLNTIHPSPVSSIPSIAPQITMSGLKITDFSVHGMSCTALLITTC